MIDQISSSMSMGNMQGPPPRQPLTDEEKQTIQDILASYDLDSITEEDAKEIFQAFKDAGITPTAGMKEAIEEAGFDAEELRKMGMSQGAGAPPPPPQQSSGIDTDLLQSLQDILNQYDLENLTSEDKTSLVSALQDAGLLNSTGNMINLSA